MSYFLLKALLEEGFWEALFSGKKKKIKKSSCQRRTHRFNLWFRKTTHAGRATSPVRHNYWVSALKPRIERTHCNHWSLSALEPACSNRKRRCDEKPLHCSEEYPAPLMQLEESLGSNEDPAHPQIKKRCLLLGRKVMTNNVLKSREITLPTKVHIVKAIVFH